MLMIGWDGLKNFCTRKCEPLCISVSVVHTHMRDAHTVKSLTYFKDSHFNKRMSPTMGPRFSHSLPVFLVIVISLISFFLLPISFLPAKYVPYHSSRRAIYAHSAKEVAAKSNADGYTHNSTIHRSLIPHAKRAVVFNDYVCKGAKLLDKIHNDPPLKHSWAPDDLQHNGWRAHPEDISEYQTAEDLEPILDTLGIPHGELDVRPVQWWQDLPFMDSSGHTNKVSYLQPYLSFSGLLRIRSIGKWSGHALVAYSLNCDKMLTGVIPARNRRTLPQRFHPVWEYHHRRVQLLATLSSWPNS